MNCSNNTTSSLLSKMKLIKLPDGLYVAVPDYIQAFEIPLPPQPGNPPILDSIHIVLANHISTKLQLARIASTSNRTCKSSTLSSTALFRQILRRPIPFLHLQLLIRLVLFLSLPTRSGEQLLPLILIHVLRFFLPPSLLDLLVQHLFTRF